MTDAEIEGVIRGLPRREPGEGLRGRVLAAAGSRPQRAMALRPALALAALVLFLALDLLALTVQDRRMAASIPRPSAVVTASESAPADDLSDLDLPRTPFVLAGLRGSEDRGETYLQLRNRMLRGVGG